MKGDLKSYYTLSAEMQQVVCYWLSKAIRPAAGIMYYSTDIIKRDYERETGLSIFNGQFKGAILASGYTPINQPDHDWILRVRPTYDKRRVLHRIGRQYEENNLPTFRINLLGEPDEELKRLVALALQAT